MRRGAGAKGGRSPTGVTGPAGGVASFWGSRLVIAADPGMRVVFPIWRNRFVPGRHVTDHQMRLFMKFRQTDTTAVAAAQASIQHGHRPTASTQDPRLPSQKRRRGSGAVPTRSPMSSTPRSCRC